MQNRQTMIHIEEEGSTLICHLIGSVDIENVNHIRQKLQLIEEKKPELFIMDMTSVDFLDSMGVGVIVSAFRQLAAIKGKMILCGLQGQPKTLVHLLQIDKVIENVASLYDLKINGTIKG